MSCTFLYNRIGELEEQVVELEKLLIEAHCLRFDSFLSDVQDFNESNKELIEFLYIKHDNFLRQKGIL